MSFLLFVSLLPSFLFFFFNDTATTEIYTLSLHDALPILLNFTAGSAGCAPPSAVRSRTGVALILGSAARVSARSRGDRKSTRLNSSHLGISYAVFCLKKKKKIKKTKSRNNDSIQRYKTIQ